MDSARFWDRVAHAYGKRAMKEYAQAYADTVALTRKYLIVYDGSLKAPSQRADLKSSRRAAPDDAPPDLSIAARKVKA
jgi:hypothetical protein